jgi:hypothetical protein
MSAMRSLRVALIALVILSCTAPPQASPTVGIQSEALPDVEIRALGTIHGDWALVLRSASGYGGPDEGEIWAVPLGGGEAKRVVGWTGFGIGSYDALRLGLTVISRQLAPDRHRIVLTVPKYARGTFGGRLAIIDLFTGQFAALDTPNILMAWRPAWSPDGKRIAFDRYENTFWTGISVIGADNSGMRFLCDAKPERGLAAFQGCYGVDGWTPDARGVRFYEVDGYSVIDADTGTITRFGVHGASLVSADWRDAATAVALGTIDDTEQDLVTYDARGSSRSVVGRAPRSGLGFFEPRWNPRSDDVLVRRGGELFVYGPSGPGRQVAAVQCEVRGEWHPSGSEVVYLAPCLGTGELHIAGAGSGTTGDRVVWSPPAGGRSDWRTIDLAVVRYP